MRFNVALVLIAGAILSACSGGSGSRASEGSASPSPQAAASATLGPDRVQYGDAANWLCRPDKSSTPCTANLDATIKAADGALSPDPFRPAADPAVDCFYIYPTVSTDPGLNSDLMPGVQEAGATLVQFARFGSVCRLFAPVYRQVTLSALTSGRFSDPQAAATAYGDVLAAWKYYFEHDNKGRGVVLVGHSQGAIQLLKLIKEQFDANPQVRPLLVSALLIGATVRVPAGSDRGGDFTNIPACRQEGQTGCVVAYSTFSAASPPPANSLFGRGALCVNPAAVGGGAADLHPYFTVAGNANAAGVSTPFVAFQGQVRGDCVESGAFSYLKVMPADGFSLPAFITAPEWGLHVYDVTLTIGDLVALVSKQVTAYRQR